MKILFICSANKDRSRTAADYFSSRYPQHQFLSAGTNRKLCQQEGTVPLEKEHLDWAELVFAMEDKHLIFAQNLSKTKLTITVLEIADEYTYYQNELIHILNEKVIL